MPTLSVQAELIEFSLCDHNLTVRTLSLTKAPWPTCTAAILSGYEPGVALINPGTLLTLLNSLALDMASNIPASVGPAVVQKDVYTSPWGTVVLLNYEKLPSL
jgi:hypothetical protein